MLRSLLHFRNDEEKKFWMEVYLSRIARREETNIQSLDAADIATLSLRNRQQLTEEQINEKITKQQKIIGENESKILEQEICIRGSISALKEQERKIQNRIIFSNKEIKILEKTIDNHKKTLFECEQKLSSKGAVRLESKDYRSKPGIASSPELKNNSDEKKDDHHASFVPPSGGVGSIV